MKRSTETKEPRSEIEIMDERMDGETDTRPTFTHRHMRLKNIYKERGGYRRSNKRVK